ncbi:M20/M25/M40 family metallo-hydrolase [Halorussus gelatinilyticus]|uniref:M20/M25/M40 family metallo-hydrolase n=1 Tax=Halorussus gelatinilyticus TaxID=2937524 RepID=A0A8U0IQ22_9EURY|nr:M20/M25/M40 family metallo-hydrolase [Halorussus gelatinilyticus]UPW02109.1 M20/M25/M40 family metallo-hydrolase [Halorussus gelatinilyticus]
MDEPAVRFADLETLVAARGPPGAEYPVADAFAELVEPHVDSVGYDEMGNVVATSEGDPDAPEILLAAHTDELAVLVEDVTDDGFLEYAMLGGHYKGNFPGQRVRVGPDGVLGVVGPKSRHYMSGDEKESLAEDLVVDVGASSRAEVAELNVEPGDHATWDREVAELAGDRVTGRALDDRLALAVLLGVARTADTDATVHYAATVQEEVGLRGARATGFSVDPDVAIAVEIFPADDYPAGGDDGPGVELGEGPVVEFGDGTSEYLFGGVLVDRRTRSWLETAGESAGASLQQAVMIGGTTDATEFQQVRGGRHAGAIAVPCRYTHSPVETVSLADAHETAAVLAEALETPFPSRDEVRWG